MKHWDEYLAGVILAVTLIYIFMVSVLSPIQLIGLAYGDEFKVDAMPKDTLVCHGSKGLYFISSDADTYVINKLHTSQLCINTFDTNGKEHTFCNDDQPRDVCTEAESYDI